MRKPCPDQKIRAQPAHSSSGPFPCFQLGCLDRLALIALGLGDPRALARRPEYASSFTSSGR
eukprot:1680477-Pleurochrysis_carterae.AAC.1